MSAAKSMAHSRREQIYAAQTGRPVGQLTPAQRRRASRKAGTALAREIRRAS